MKVVKNVLFILALFIANSTDVRSMAGSPASTSSAPAKPTVESKATSAPAAPAKKTPAPTATKQSFQSLLTQVRAMQPDEVIKEGVIATSFASLVTESSLEPELTKALYEAGIHLHIPLSGTNEDDIKLIASAHEAFAEFRPSQQKEKNIPQQKSGKQKI